MKITITSDEAIAILRYVPITNLRQHIREIMQIHKPTIEGLPSEELLKESEEDGIIFLDQKRTEWVALYDKTAKKPFVIYESLGEDAGSDDDPTFECKTYEELHAWYLTMQL